MRQKEPGLVSGKKVGVLFKDVRETMGLTLEQTAKVLEISVEELEIIEAGERTFYRGWVKLALETIIREGKGQEETDPVEELEAVADRVGRGDFYGVYRGIEISEKLSKKALIGIILELGGKGRP